MKKIIIFTTLIGLFFLTIAFLLFNNKKIEEKDNVAFFFELIEKGTGVIFSNTHNSVVEWRVIDENDNVVIVEKAGKIMEINNIGEVESQKIDNFFEENSFELDIYNLADGPEGNLKGYRKNKMYCILTRDYNLDGNNSVTNMDVKINCAI